MMLRKIPFARAAQPMILRRKCTAGLADWGGPTIRWSCPAENGNAYSSAFESVHTCNVSAGGQLIASRCTRSESVIYCSEEVC